MRRVDDLALLTALSLVTALVACGGEPPTEPFPAPPPPPPGVALSLADLGPVEFPGPALREPVPWLGLSLAGAVVVIAVALLLATRLRRPAVLEEEPPPDGALHGPPPQDAALRRLRALRDARPAGADDVLAFHVEVASLLRDYAGERFVLRSREMTTEELAAALPPDRRTSLSGPLSACDLVKFARQVPDDARRATLLDAAERFVRETSP